MTQIDNDDLSLSTRREFGGVQSSLSHHDRADGGPRPPLHVNQEARRKTESRGNREEKKSKRM